MGSSGRGGQIQYLLPYICVHGVHADCVRCLVRAVNLWKLWPCGCDGQRSRSKDEPILSVSSIISIIMAFTGRVLWFSFVAVISRHCRENQRTLCNFSIWTVADVGLHKKAVPWQRNRAMPLYTSIVPKFTAASRGSPYDSTASCLFNHVTSHLLTAG